jgi:hypothetical protein
MGDPDGQRYRVGLHAARHGMESEDCSSSVGSLSPSIENKSSVIEIF